MILDLLKCSDKYWNQTAYTQYVLPPDQKSLKSCSQKDSTIF